MTAVAPPVRSSLAQGWSVAWALAMRGLVRIQRLPTIIIPAVVMPVFFVVAFSGAFSSLAELRDFGTSNVVSWMAPFAILQGAAFGGAGAAGATAQDIENGFYDRLLMAPVQRWALLVGPLVYAVIRSILPTVLVMLVAWAAGAEFPGGMVGIAVTFGAAMGVALVAGTWGMWVTYVFRTQRAQSVIQIGIFALMFLSIGQVSLALMSGWLHGVARVNPLTNVMRMARQGFLGDVTWSQTWPGLLALGAMTLVFGLLAYRSLGKLVR